MITMTRSSLVQNEQHPLMALPARLPLACREYKHRNDPPLFPVPCQICGKPEYKEAYCPSAKTMGFFEDECQRRSSDGQEGNMDPVQACKSAWCAARTIPNRVPAIQPAWRWLLRKDNRARRRACSSSFCWP